MPHLTVLIDGQESFSGDVPEWTLPSRPEFFPAALQAEGNPNAPTTPLARLFLITALIELMRATLINHPRLGLRPDAVTITTGTPGQFTLTVASPVSMEVPNGHHS